MSGSELLKMMKRMDENAEQTTRLVAQEVSSYIETHQSGVARQLKVNGEAQVPTSVGSIRITLKDIEEGLRARQLVA
jgi:KaiC/GvpD/RAD55 family RecA-like ATPase